MLAARAASGDADAIFRLGHRLAYGRGRGRPEPWREIAALWRRALRLGQERTHLHLARLYVDGRGVARSVRRAVDHYTRASLLGFVAAHYELGCLLRERGRGEDLHDAVNAFALGAACGDADCMAELGFMFHEGLGRRRNPREAVHHYRRAARRGVTRAMFNLALSYEAGDGVAASPRRARHWMRRAAAAGHRAARLWLRSHAAPAPAR